MTLSGGAKTGISPVGAVSCAAMSVLNLEPSLWISCRYVPVSVIWPSEKRTLGSLNLHELAR